MKSWQNNSGYGYGRNIRQEKNLIREELLAKRKSFPEEQRAEMDSAICRRLLSLMCVRYAEDILKRLHGKKHLIIGNHDGSWLNETTRKYFESISPYTETTDGRHALTLCHYPLLTYYHDTKAYMIHGHLHNNTNVDFFPLLVKRERVLNAGVDLNGFMPVTFDELCENNRVFKEAYEENSYTI